MKLGDDEIVPAPSGFAMKPSEILKDAKDNLERRCVENFTRNDEPSAAGILAHVLIAANLGTPFAFAMLALLDYRENPDWREQFAAAIADLEAVDR